MNHAALGFPECLSQAWQLAEAISCRFGEFELHRFPDRESLVTLPTPLDETLVFFRGLHDPNAKLAELMMLALPQPAPTAVSGSFWSRPIWVICAGILRSRAVSPSASASLSNGSPGRWTT